MKRIKPILGYTLLISDFIFIFVIIFLIFSDWRSFGISSILACASEIFAFIIFFLLIYWAFRLLDEHFEEIRIAHELSGIYSQSHNYISKSIDKDKIEAERRKEEVGMSPSGTEEYYKKALYILSAYTNPNKKTAADIVWLKNKLSEYRREKK